MKNKKEREKERGALDPAVIKKKKKKVQRTLGKKKNQTETNSQVCTNCYEFCMNKFKGKNIYKKTVRRKNNKINAKVCVKEEGEEYLYLHFEIL